VAGPEPPPKEGTPVHTKRRWTWLIAILAATTLLAAACGDDEGDGGGGGGDGASGEVNISGSSTVEPITTAVADLLAEENDAIEVTVDGPGTGDGFELFCKGETDISDASRPIDEEEAAACEEAGIEFIELKVAVDGISVLTSPNNDIECLNFADMYALIGPESADVEKWSDAQDLATELGSDTQLPDAPLDISAPGAESGTYDSFLEIVTGDISEARAEEGKITEDQVETARDFPGQSDDNIIIQGIEGSDSSFGWVGFAFAEEAGDQVKEIPIAAEPGGDCVEPSPETIASNEYPISRDLFIYVNKAKAEENPAVSAFVDFYLTDEGIASVSDVGYVDLTDEALQATRDLWEAKTAGTQVG
jgi:phosphate transport system substrate-binding protein